MHLQFYFSAFILAIQISAIAAFSEDFQSAFHPRSAGRRRIVAAAAETKSRSRNSMLTRSKYSSKLPHPLVPRFPVIKTDAFSDESAEVVYNPIIQHKFVRPVKHGDNSSEESDEILPPYNDTNPDPAAYDSAVNQGQFPGYAVFYYLPYPFCGGSLITQKHILTAGHCFSNLLKTPGAVNRVRVYLNTATTIPIASKTVVRAVKDVRVHPDFDEAAPGKFLKNDIALVELDDEVQDIRRVRTPKRTISYEKELVSLYGIGARSWTFGYLPGLHPTENFFLKTTSSYVISNELCASMWGADELKDEQYICTTENRGPCFGDGGAPVISDGAHVGIISYKPWQCKENLPAIHTRVDPYRNWIKYVVDDD